MKHRTDRITRAIQCFLAILIALGLTSASSQPTGAQTGPETVWEEGRLVILADNQPAAASIMAVPTVSGTYYRTVSGTSFQPTASSMTYAPLGGAVYVTAIPPGGYSLSHELHLPHGATITEVVFFVTDNDATNMSVSLRSYAPETNSFLTLETGASVGASATLQTIILPVDPPLVVDNTITSYRLRVVPGVASSDHLLYGARVGYTMPTNFLPIIER